MIFILNLLKFILPVLIILYILIKLNLIKTHIIRKKIKARTARYRIKKQEYSTNKYLKKYYIFISQIYPLEKIKYVNLIIITTIITLTLLSYISYQNTVFTVLTLSATTIFIYLFLTLKKQNKVITITNDLEKLILNTKANYKKYNDLITSLETTILNDDYSKATTTYITTFITNIRQAKSDKEILQILENFNLYMKSKIIHMLSLAIFFDIQKMNVDSILKDLLLRIKESHKININKKQEMLDPISMIIILIVILFGVNYFGQKYLYGLTISLMIKIMLSSYSGILQLSLLILCVLANLYILLELRYKKLDI